MMTRLTLSAFVALGLGLGGATLSHAAGGGSHTHDVDFSFEGPFGKFDQNQLQRGLKVYTEVCAACHGLQYVPFRALGDPGGTQYSEAQVRAYASTYEVYDADLDDFRPATPNDYFPVSGIAEAPDLSLMAKARAGFHGPYGLGLNQLFRGMGGPEYITNLLVSYEDPPECAPEDFSGHYNTYFTAGGYPDSCKDEDGNHTVPGSWISMAPPLVEGQVEFDDGHANDVEHMSEDISAFLMWTAEPKMMARKQAGVLGVFFLLIPLAALLYLTNKKLWAPIKHPEEDHS